MADYPTSVKTFTTKVADQVIDPAHVNDIQDEVNAIETGLLNGVAHDIVPLTASSRNLGSSTLPWKSGHFDALEVGGAAVTAAGGLPDAVRVRLSTRTEIASESTQTILWGSLVFDTSTGDMFDSTVSQEHLVPASSGLYTCRLQVGFDLSAQVASTGSHFVVIYDSSGAEVAKFQGAMNSTFNHVNISGMKYFDSVAGSTQWVRASVYSDAASTSSLDADVTTFFEMVKM